MFFEVLLFSLSVTTPIFVWLCLGIGLNFAGWLPQRLSAMGTWFVFHISLPLLMFTSISRQPLLDAVQPRLTLVLLGCTLMVYWLAKVWSRRQQMMPNQATVFQQGALRGNLGIVGLSLCLNAYGSDALATVSVLMALVTVLYNVLSVVLFVRGMSDDPVSIGQLFKQIFSNPLIVAIVAGLPISLARLSLPDWFVVSSETVISVSLPLALVCIGASMNYRDVREGLALLWQVSAFKLVLMPVVAVGILLLLGVHGQSLGTAFLLCASPTAAASYVVARAYGGDAALAANIVVFTTVLSLVSISAGVFMLSFFGLM
ncbi:AEC family transporter [Pseudomaricurvus alkylphenolicus]|jgi:predicted permease|uniref:AEC family transporter n=1 Tax=Pseudomaricurvus alkylphenolicus TaxID=1306991 RepID=UPI00142029F1|nr:AEC family transporter [Pseudomaricurvus alkylphenolicus]NIB41143.1 AEC family transporter [Pseudomaricurvus alkylphenolicus]